MKFSILILSFPFLLQADDLMIEGKLIAGTPELGHPQKGQDGGAGDRVVFAAGDPGNEPYSMGMSRGLLWSSVPGGSAFAWFTGSDLSARIDHMGTSEFYPGPGAPGVRINASHNGDTSSDWDLVIHNEYCPPVHRLAGFRLGNDGHLEVSNKILIPLEEGVSNVSARLGFSGWTSVSDARVKKNLHPLSDSLAMITALEPVTYQFKWEEGDELRPGFTAQNVEKVLPSLVEDDGKLKTLNYAAMSAVAIAGLKEQQVMIQSLKQENEELRKRLERLEKIILKQAKAQ
ncbi:tail fiber domain-containing protein [Verrucomicrobiaceae bacterium 227]